VKIVRALFFIALFIAIASLVLLLNFTASNPTHRRYSSIPALTTGEGTGQEIGRSGEDILARDLELPRNDQPDQRQCICSASTASIPNECRVCVVQLQDISSTSSRRPDFVSPEFIAEVKNRRDLRYPSNEFQQITDYASAAKKLDIPLWLFVRVNTAMDPQYYKVVRSTGGNIVFYIATPDYDDPVDQKSKIALIISGVICVITISQGFTVFRLKIFREQDAVNKAEETTNSVEDFLQSAKERAKARLDE
jgi:hypothetical protein